MRLATIHHKYGLLGPDGWHEEWIASKLATLFVRRRLTPNEEKWLMGHLGRAMAGLEPLLDGDRDTSGVAGAHSRAMRLVCLELRRFR